MFSNPIVRFELIRAAASLGTTRCGRPPGWCWCTSPGCSTAPSTSRGWRRRVPGTVADAPPPALDADLLVLELVWTQGVAILLLVPGLMAGSIAEEDRGGTMRDLLGTPLSGGSIVVGKLAVRLVQVGAAMAIGLPVVVPLASLEAKLDLAVVARPMRC